MEFLGVAEFQRALDGWVKACNQASKESVVKGGHLIEARAKTKLTTYTHPKGEPTNSPPGSPPALVRGTLRRSVKVRGPHEEGPFTWSSETGPTAIYGRIQELGGYTGSHGSHLPPRPYLAPALRECQADGSLVAIYVAAWRAAGQF